MSILIPQVLNSSKEALYIDLQIFIRRLNSSIEAYLKNFSGNDLELIVHYNFYSNSSQFLQHIFFFNYESTKKFYGCFFTYKVL
jgi:hypothetical protein